ncbi:hypothetical protein F3Y22_tig00008007pilonHSYRG00001 [Hibiscus syriacus]|uniref:Uncharacterized protein n=1 Tax=Hibiscus syriacus TaxID=106335 RepID=A0A6A3C9W3_HIBSY|nr:hypothetical protein F3Y22_tig00008007pilonHSYRG00001 [Hibiscus syriacus]
MLSLNPNDVLKLDYDKLEQEKQALASELMDLKAKLKEENSEGSSQSVKEDSSKFSRQTKDRGSCENDDDSNGAVKERNGNAQMLISPSLLLPFRSWILLIFGFIESSLVSTI